MLEGICDAKRRFLDVFTGPPGKIHDSRIYNLSFISEKLQLSATRVRIENTFGILKTLFRQLQHVDMWSVDRMSKFVIVCYILHNICIDNNDLWEDYVPEQIILDVMEPEADNVAQRAESNDGPADENLNLTVTLSTRDTRALLE
ncbi:hypothetical protein NQ317_014187, partial [Molorchus minor]